MAETIGKTRRDRNKRTIFEDITKRRILFTLPSFFTGHVVCRQTGSIR